VFATTDFGYRRITVERPLRLRFEVTEEVLAELAAVRAVARFDDHDALITALRGLVGAGPSTTRSEFTERLTGTLRRAGLGPLPSPVDRAVWSAVSVTDPGGELQTDRAGDPLPDPDLRDHENVPLGEDIHSHLRRDVLPHVPDAWIDDTKTKIGYEIPFTRHFHVGRAARPLAEIDAELRRLDADIQRLLPRMTG
jgi:type I restriction enzyme M protein